MSSSSDLKLAQDRVALWDLDHLVRWLEASGRAFAVFSSRDLVEALRGMKGDGGEPAGLRMFQEVVSVYAAYRARLPSGEVREEVVVAPDGTHGVVRVPEMKGDLLTVTELDRAIRQLVREMYDLRPDWSLEGDPL